MSGAKNAMSSYPLLCTGLQRSALFVKEMAEKVDEWDMMNQSKMEELAASNRPLQEIYDEFRIMRDRERREMESRGLVDRQNARKNLKDALQFQGSCLAMCPAVERIRRSIERNVSPIEKDEDGKISALRAVKAFSRPAAGQPPPLPSDVRPPRILVQTLEYLVETALPQLPSLHGFLWDRTRSIRQDFTYQNYGGVEAIQCCEIITRIHIVSLHIMAAHPGEYSRQQELEQFHKTLQTLNDLYALYPDRSLDDFPFEPEMRAYQLLSRLSDPSLDYLSVPNHVEVHPIVNMARQLRSMVRSFQTTALITKLFREIRADSVPPLVQSVMEIHFNQLRVVAVRQLWRSLHSRNGKYPLARFKEYLGFESIEETCAFCEHHRLIMSEEDVDIRTWNESDYRDRTPLAQPCSSWIQLGPGTNLKSIVWPSKSSIGTKLSQGQLPQLSIRDVTQDKIKGWEKIQRGKDEMEQTLRQSSEIAEHKFNQERKRAEEEKTKLLNERAKRESMMKQQEKEERKRAIARLKNGQRIKRQQFVASSTESLYNQLVRDVISRDALQIALSESLNRRRIFNDARKCLVEILRRARQHRRIAKEESSFIREVSNDSYRHPKVSNLWSRRRRQSQSFSSERARPRKDPWSTNEVEQAVNHARTLGVSEAKLQLNSATPVSRSIFGLSLSPEAPLLVDATQAKDEEEAASILAEKLKSVKPHNASSQQINCSKRQRRLETDESKYYASLRKRRLGSVDASSFLSSTADSHSFSESSADLTPRIHAAPAPIPRRQPRVSLESPVQRSPKKRKHSGPLARLKELIARSYDLI